MIKMKKIVVIIVSVMLFGCGSSSNKKNTVDTMNRIGSGPAQDTTPSSSSMNGYAPPNTTTDTSQRIKDSMNNANKH